MSRCRNAGFGLVEVLVSIVIFVVALLGIAGLAVHTVRQEAESSQRVEALVMLQDMVDRFMANRAVADCYSNGATGRELGTGVAANPCGGSSDMAQAELDLEAWDAALQGTGVRRDDDGTAIGLINARGCIERIDATQRLYRITVAWQGLAPTVAPALDCGSDEDGDDAQRRAVSALVQLGILS